MTKIPVTEEPWRLLFCCLEVMIIRTYITVQALICSSFDGMQTARHNGECNI